MIRTVVLSIAVSSCLSFPASATEAPSDRAVELSQRIDVAGRQRMLIQRIARASCFALSQIDGQNHATMAADSILHFEMSQSLLRSGDRAKGFLAEDSELVIQRLNDVDAIWQTLGAANRQINAGDVNRIVLLQLVNLTDPATDAANETVRSLVAKGSEWLSEDLAHTIDVAGFQRMLSQRAAKEYCLLNLGIETERNRTRLIETVALFEDRLSDLEGGSNGVVPPPNPFVSMELRWVRLSWNKVKPLYERAIAGEMLDDDMSLLIGQLTEKVLQNMDSAVGHYTLSN